MHAIIAAGGKLNTEDPLFIEVGLANKALIPLAGKPMVQWVVEALLGSKHIEGVVIVGLQPSDLNLPDLPIQYAPETDNVVNNVLAGLELVKKQDPNYKWVLVSTADIPLIKPEMIDNFIETAQTLGAEAIYPLVTDKTMESRFPNSKRTFTKMKGGRYSGGNITLASHVAPLKINYDLLRGITGERKNFVAQARLIGIGFIIRFLLGLMTIEEAAQRASIPFNVIGKVIDWPNAEVAMDVDKQHQYHIIKQEIEAKHGL